jgi:hypothetical protein
LGVIFKGLLLLKYLFVLSVIFSLISCKSKDEAVSSIEEQIIGTWVSSECFTYTNADKNSESQKQQYTFSDDTVIETWNYYVDSDCNNFIGSSDLISPLIKHQIIQSDTGESVLQLEWIYSFEDGTVTETNLSVYVEGSSLYFGNIDLKNNNIPSTIRFDEPFYKLEN